jgi:hypothetical protein
MADAVPQASEPAKPSLEDRIENFSERLLKDNQLLWQLGAEMAGLHATDGVDRKSQELAQQYEFKRKSSIFNKSVDNH